MIVSNTVWTLAGETSPSRIDMQNVGRGRIAFVIAASLPGPAAIDMDVGEHGVLFPAEPLTTLLSLAGNVYVRAIGPIPGNLYVHSVT